jgi:hypothetical protein
MKRLLGLLVLAAGVTVLAFVAFNFVQDASLWILGRRAQAQVVDVWIEQNAGEREAPTFRWFIRYQFTTLNGRLVTGVSRVSAAELAALGHTGSVDVVYSEEEAAHRNEVAIDDAGWVNVVYFPPYPVHNRLDESRFVPVLACAYVPLILLGGASLKLARSLLQNT